MVEGEAVGVEVFLGQVTDSAVADFATALDEGCEEGCEEEEKGDEIHGGEKALFASSKALT